MYDRERNVAILAARRAGRVAAEMHDSDLRSHAQTDEKDGATDLVTEGDRRAQREIHDTIRTHFPDDHIVSEEDVGSPGSPGSREWVVDPIDGTMNFATGLPLYNTSIAFREDGEVQVGAVLSPDPALGRLWYAVRGEGAESTTLDGAPSSIETTDYDRLSGSVVDSFDFAPFEGREVNHRRIASAALSFCLVADGSVDAYVTPYPLDEWDEAAGRLILAEAGGRVTDRREDSPMVASNGTDLHECILDAVEHRGAGGDE